MYQEARLCLLRIFPLLWSQCFLHVLPKSTMRSEEAGETTHLCKRVNLGDFCLEYLVD